MRTISGFLITSLISVSVGNLQASSIDFVNIEAEYRIPALKYGLSPIMFKALLMAESSLDHTKVNPETLDFGIGQINYRTAEAYKIDTSKLIHDRGYSIERSAFVVSEFKKQFASSEPTTWLCRYNVGWGKLGHSRSEKCLKYIANIKSIMEGL